MLGGQIVEGFARGDGTKETLSLADLGRCFEGKVKLLEASVRAAETLRTHMISDECSRPRRCKDVLQRFVDELREAAGEVLPPAMAEVVLATEQPYLQTVADVRVPAMADGRIALIGDAAFAAWPHAAAGTAKAADDAWTLHDHLAGGDGEVAAALRGWCASRMRTSACSRAAPAAARGSLLCPGLKWWAV